MQNTQTTFSWTSDEFIESLHSRLRSFEENHCLAIRKRKNFGSIMHQQRLLTSIGLFNYENLGSLFKISSGFYFNLCLGFLITKSQATSININILSSYIIIHNIFISNILNRQRGVEAHIVLLPIYSSNCCGCMQQLLIQAALVAACICSDWSMRREGVQNNARWIFPNQLKYSLGLFCSKSHILSRYSRMVMTVQNIIRMKIA